MGEKSSIHNMSLIDLNAKITKAIYLHIWLELIFNVVIHSFLIANAMLFSNAFSHDYLVERIASNSTDHTFPSCLSVVKEIA